MGAEPLLSTIAAGNDAVHSSAGLQDSKNQEHIRVYGVHMVKATARRYAADCIYSCAVVVGSLSLSLSLFPTL